MTPTSKGPLGYWTWRSGADRHDVRLYRESLYWYWEGHGYQGGGTSQSFEDFFARGPLERDVPDAILAEIRAAIAAHGSSSRATQPPAAQASAAPAKDSAALADTQATTPGLSDDRNFVLVAGLGIILLGSLVAGVLALAVPFWGTFAAGLPMLAGLAAAALYGSAMLAVAGVLGLASAVTVVLALPLYLSAQKLEAPAFSRDLRVRADLAGSHDFITTRQSGASRVQQGNRAHAAPFATASWSTRQPIALWIACTTSTGHACLPSPTAQLKYLRPVRQEEMAPHLAAVRSAVAQHRLTLADRPRIYQPANPMPALRLVIGAPLAAGAVFLLGALWRLRRREV